MIDKIILQDIGEGIEQVEVSEISVKIGDNVSKNDIGLVVETEKASMEIPVSMNGIIKEILINNGDYISPGAEIFVIDKSNSESIPKDNRKKDEPLKKDKSKVLHSKKTTPSHKSLKENIVQKKSISASPSVRRFARELGCELKWVSGTGLKGRITKDDVQNFIKSKLNNNQFSNSNLTYQMPSIDFSQFGETENHALNKIRKISGQRLQAAWNSIPHVTQFDKADITELDKLRKLLNNSKIESSPKMSYLPFIMKAVVQALKEFPDFNSSLDASGKSLILKKYFHIGIAVDTPNGLMVPVVRDVDKKSVPKITNELNDISQRARNKKLKPEELTGSCFTISSLGGINGTAFTPIVNPPEVAILGISKTNWEPVYNGNSFIPKLLLPLSLSYDHRVIDGAAAAKFTKSLSDQLSAIETIPKLDIY